MYLVTIEKEAHRQGEISGALRQFQGVFLEMFNTSTPRWIRMKMRKVLRDSTPKWDRPA